MNKHVYLLVLVCTAACLVRLYPAVITGLPFSTDGWSLIRNTELLLQYTPVPLSSPIFDGYNSFWPASSIFGAVVSEVTGVSPVMVMAFLVPFAGSVTVPIFFCSSPQNHLQQFYRFDFIHFARHHLPLCLIHLRGHQGNLCKSHTGWAAFYLLDEAFF